MNNIYKIFGAKNKTEHTNAFTLIELMVVFAVLAILIILALISYRSQISKGYDARRKADLDRIKIAIEAYEKDHNCYPLPSSLVCNPGTGLQPYLDQIPCDPVTHATYYYEYEDSSCPTWWRLYTNLDNSSDPQIMPFCGPGDSFNYYVSSSNAPNCIPSGSSSGSGGSSGGASPSPGSVDTGNFYGCFSGVCAAISWDPARNGPECDPNYQNPTCYGQCGTPESPTNECQPWR